MQKVVIIIPILNEEELLEKFYISLKKKCLEIKRYKFQFLFVVDKSKDKTEIIIDKICNIDKQCSSIIMDDIYGHQECLYAGLENSKKFDVIITMDGDFQHPIELIKKMIIEYENGADGVFTIKKIQYKKNFITKMFASLFYIFFNLMSEEKLINNSSDFRLITNNVLNKLLEKNWKSAPFLRGELLKLSFEKKVLSFTPIDRTVGISKFTISRLFKLALLGLFASSKRPIKIIFSSFLLFLISKIYLINLFSYENKEIIYNFLNFSLILLIMISLIMMIYWFSLKFIKKKSEIKIYKIRKKLNI